MKRRFLVYFFALILILSSFVVLAASTPDVYGIEDTAKDLEGVTDSINNAVDNPKQEFDRVINKTDAEKRVEKINSYIGPITKTLWGYEFSLSWKFIFAFIMWILLIELIVVPASQVFDLNTFGSLAIAGIIATLAMQGIGKNMVIFLDSLINVWYAGLMTIVTMIIIGMIYQVGMRYLGGWFKRQKKLSNEEMLDRDREWTKTRGELDKQALLNEAKTHVKIGNNVFKGGIKYNKKK